VVRRVSRRWAEAQRPSQIQIGPVPTVHPSARKKIVIFSSEPSQSKEKPCVLPSRTTKKDPHLLVRPEYGKINRSQTPRPPSTPYAVCRCRRRRPWLAAGSVGGWEGKPRSGRRRPHPGLLSPGSLRPEMELGWVAFCGKERNHDYRCGRSSTPSTPTKHRAGPSSTTTSTTSAPRPNLSPFALLPAVYSG
jgi:hypothetical protein